MDNDVIGMGSTNRQACAACKHQRKKCSQQCLLSPFFPAEKNQQFQAVHKLFGVSNVTKLLKSLRFEERQQAIDSLIWEAQRRELDPILGCYGDYIRMRNELQLLKTQQQQQQQQQQHEVIVASAAAQTDHVQNMMNNKQLMIDYPYHNNNNNNGITGGGGGAGAGADTTVVNYNNNNGYLQRNAGLMIMEQNQHQHQHGYGPSMNVQGQEKRFQTIDSTTNGHVICFPNSFNQSHTFNHQNPTLYYDTGKL